MKTILKPQRTVEELLEDSYLHTRSALLETAATFDRLQRLGGDDFMKSEKIKRLKEACYLIADEQENRTVRFLKLFSEE
ncbi:MAG: hypothetical protein U9O87_01795 [Verrucomicrobiota bacterium]|nr:hypothetical protein [Verrucomicrobiota bacterium]